jgi:hypothetical protein
VIVGVANIPTILQAGRSEERLSVEAIDVSVLQIVQHGSGGPPSLLFSEHPSSSSGVKRPGRGVQHLPLRPRLRVSGSSALLPLYAFIAWT